jgi:hypothetical protein
MEPLGISSPCIQHPTPRGEEGTSLPPSLLRVGGVCLNRGTQSSGFEGKCACGLWEPRRGRGAGVSASDADRVPATGESQGPLLAGADFGGDRHVGPSVIIHPYLFCRWIFFFYFDSSTFIVDDIIVAASA